MNIQKLIKILNLTKSDSDGEVLNAVRAANAILAKTGLTWGDVLGVGDGETRELIVEEMLGRLRALRVRGRTREFLDSLERFYRKNGFLTERQEKRLREIFNQIKRETL